MVGVTYSFSCRALELKDRFQWAFRLMKYE